MPPPSIVAGPPIAISESLRRDDDVRAAQNRRVARVAPPGRHADHRHRAAQVAHLLPRAHIGVPGAGSVRVAGAPPGALAVEDQRQREIVGQLHHPVRLLVSAPALRTGEDRVVVRDKDRPCALRVEQVPVDRPDPRHQPIRRRLADQLLQRSLLALPRDRQRAVLHPRALVDQLRDVLPHRPTILAVPSLHRRRPVLIQQKLPPVVDRLQARADVIDIDRVIVIGDRLAHLPQLNERQRMGGEDRLPHLHGDRAHDAAKLRFDDVFHLQRAHDEQQLALADRVPLGDVDLRHGPLQWSGHRIRVGRANNLRRRPLRRRLALAKECQRGQRIPFVQRRARAPSGRRGRFPSARLNRDQRLHVVVHPAGVDATAREVGVRNDVAQKRRVRLQAPDHKLAQGARQALHRRLKAARRRVRDHLGQQRVEVRVRPIPRVAERVHAHARPRRQMERRQLAPRRANVAIRQHLLGVHAGLNREAARRRNRRLLQAQLGQRLPARDPQLRSHQIDPADLLRHRVLHLQPRVRLNEEEALVVRSVLQKLERPQAAVVHRLRQPHRRRRNLIAHLRPQRRAGRKLHELLVAALHAALALAHMAHRPRAIADDLNLDVPRPRDQLLHIDRARSERRLRFRPAPRVRLLHIRRRRHHPHPATAAARQRLDHNRAPRAQPLQELARLRPRHRPRAARQHRHVMLRRPRPRPRLVPQQFQRLHRRPHERDPLLPAAPRELRVLGQEAVAGMDRVAAGLLRRRHHPLDIHVGRRSRPVQRDRLRRAPGVQRCRVVAGVDRDRLNAQLLGRPHDPNRDLAPIGDQQLVDSYDTRPSSHARPVWRSPSAKLPSYVAHILITACGVAARGI